MKRRILALVHQHLVPPEDTTGIDVLEAEWKMEFDVIETLKEIGHDVRLKKARGRSDPGEIVVDTEHAHFMVLLAQRLDDVVLHLPFRLEDVDPRRILRRNEMLVDEREDAALHRSRRCPPLWRWFMVCTVRSTVNSCRA